MITRSLILACLGAVAAWAQPGQPLPQASSMRGSTQLPAALEGVGITQRLNQQLPLDLVFRDEYGQAAPLGQYSGRKPVLLALVYFECPMLCTQILNGMEMGLKAVSFNPGRDFEVVVVSFDPKDTPELALAKKRNYVRRYGRPDTANGWHFLTGEPEAIRTLTEAVGFHYRFDAATRQFAHASAIYLTTAQGRLSHYFYGVDYSPRDLRLGLVEASENKIGNPVDAVLLYCYHYDPATGKYGAIALNMLRIAAAAFVIFGAGFLWLMLRRDWRSAHEVHG